MERHALQHDALKRIWIVTGAEDFVEFPILQEFVRLNDFLVDIDSEVLEG